MMAISVQDGTGGFQQMAASAALHRITIASHYLKVYWTVPRAQTFAKIAIAGSICEAALFLASVWVSPTVTAVLWTTSMFGAAPLWFNIAHRLPRATIPVNVEHMAERYGLFTMLFLGESIIAIVTETRVDSINDAIIVFFGFAIVYAVRAIYYGAQPNSPDDHALRLSINRARVFVYGHILLNAGLIGLGTGIKLMKTSAKNGKSVVPRSESVLTSLSLALVLTVVNATRLAHSFTTRNRFVWSTRVFVIGLIAASPAMMRQSNPQTFVSLLASYATFLAIIDAIASDAVLPERSTVFNEVPLPDRLARLSEVKRGPAELEFVRPTKHGQRHSFPGKSHQSVSSQLTRDSIVVTINENNGPARKGE